MREKPDGGEVGLQHRVHGTRENASFQVIVLGANGGPREDTATGLLVRSPQSQWRKGSVIAVDAGAHLASIITILQHYMPHRSDQIATPGFSRLLERGPFAGISFPFISAKANALFVFRDLLHSFLITHPHLDHLSAMAINTPALEYGREAKAIVALPSVIDAIKAHIFNDSIWPNLSDEGHGAGFVTYRRLTEGGNQRLGSGEARGYVSVCDGLATKCLAVTHGKCHRRSHSASHSRGESTGWLPGEYSFPSRRLSRMSDDHNYFAAIAQQQAYGNAGAHSNMQIPPAPLTPILGGAAGGLEKDFLHEPVTSSAFFIRNDVTGKEILIFGDIEPDSVSMAPRNYLVWEEAAPKIVNGLLQAIFIECSFDDDVRDADLFGHLCPRHLIAELESLAKRVISYRERKNDLQRRKSFDTPSTQYLGLSQSPAQSELLRKRKRGLNGDVPSGVEAELNFKLPTIDPSNSGPGQYVGNRSFSQPYRRVSRDLSMTGGHSPLQRPLESSKIARHVQFSTSPRTQNITLPTHEVVEPISAVSEMGAPAPPSVAPSAAVTEAVTSHSQPLSTEPVVQERLLKPLRGLTVHVIHVKDTMVDGRSPGEIIAEQLEDQAAELNLGCDFDVTDSGETIWI